MLPGQGECEIVPGKLKSTANGTERGFLFLEELLCLLSRTLGFAARRGCGASQEASQCDADFSGI